MFARGVGEGVPIGFLDGLLLFASAGCGGALNSVAGGGSFFTFPALVFLGVPPVTANATSAVALWPGLPGREVNAAWTRVRIATAITANGRFGPTGRPAV